MPTSEQIEAAAEAIYNCSLTFSSGRLRILEAAEKALSAAEGVKVLELVWEQCEDEDDPNWEVAETIVGRYSIEKGTLYLTTIRHGMEDLAILAKDGDLKAAAQADYEARIRSALEGA